MKLSSVLAKWYSKYKRDLPWRETNSPYYIWLSEIILQQTRVNQGLDYYRRFVAMYPRIEDLAAAPVDEVLKLWQGLGYYTRARNMHETAKNIVFRLNGRFPQAYSELIKLKGIGRYTAAAVASLAFNEPVAVVDGNVYRVISRLFGIAVPVDSNEGKQVFELKANELLDTSDPGRHNQAIMEFGALVCLPRNPLCEACVLAFACKARTEGTVDSFPVKKSRGRNRVRYFNYVFIQYNTGTLLRKRNQKDIWHSLYEFPLIETDNQTSFNNILNLQPLCDILNGGDFILNDKERTYQHKLTHQTLVCNFNNIVLSGEPRLEQTGYAMIPLQQLGDYAIPRVIDRYLQDLSRDRML